MQHRLPAQYAKILHGLTRGLDGADLKSAISIFAVFLRKDGAAKRVDEIAKEYERIAAKERGEEPVEITTARQIGETAVEELKTAFSAGAVSKHTDTALLAGVVIRKGNTIYDASIKTQLGKLAQFIS